MQIICELNKYANEFNKPAILRLPKNSHISIIRIQFASLFVWFTFYFITNPCQNQRIVITFT